MAPDFPFFTRETQQLRKRLPAFLVCLGLAGAMAAGLLLLYLRLVPPVRRSPGSDFYAVLVLAHFASTLAAAGWGSTRILAAEHGRSTLDGVRLLPARPFLLLGQKLLFPVVVLLLAWLVPFPVHIIAIVTGSTAAGKVRWLYPLPILLGLAFFPAALLLPPDLRDRLHKLRQRAHTGLRAPDPDLGVRILLLYVTGLTGFWLSALLFIGRWRPGRTLPGTGIPGWLVLATVLGLFVGVSFVTGAATLSGEPDDERRAARARSLALVGLYYGNLLLLFGPRWGALPPWLTWGAAVILPGWIALSLRSPGARKSDPWAAEEVSWFARRTENPMLVRDLRSSTRMVSMRKCMLMELLGLSVMAGGLTYLVVRSGGSPAEVLTALTTMAALAAVAIVTVGASLQMWVSWTRERTAGTLDLLYLVPQSGRTLLDGRLYAGLIFAFFANLPLMLFIPVALWLSVQRGETHSILLVLLGAPVLAGLTVQSGCNATKPVYAPWKWKPDDWWEAGLVLGQVCGFVAWSVALGFSSPSGAPSPALGFSYILLLLAECWAAVQIHRIKVRQFEVERSGG